MPLFVQSWVYIFWLTVDHWLEAYYHHQKNPLMKCQVLCTIGKELLLWDFYYPFQYHEHNFGWSLQDWQVCWWISASVHGKSAIYLQQGTHKIHVYLPYMEASYLFFIEIDYQSFWDKITLKELIKYRYSNII